MWAREKLHAFAEAAFFEDSSALSQSQSTAPNWPFDPLPDAGVAAAPSPVLVLPSSALPLRLRAASSSWRRRNRISSTTNAISATSAAAPIMTPIVAPSGNEEPAKSRAVAAYSAKAADGCRLRPGSDFLLFKPKGDWLRFGGLLIHTRFALVLPAFRLAHRTFVVSIRSPSENENRLHTRVEALGRPYRYRRLLKVGSLKVGLGWGPKWTTAFPRRPPEKSSEQWPPRSTSPLVLRAGRPRLSCRLKQPSWERLRLKQPGWERLPLGQPEPARTRMH